MSKFSSRRRMTGGNGVLRTVPASDLIVDTTCSASRVLVAPRAFSLSSKTVLNGSPEGTVLKL